MGNSDKHTIATPFSAPSWEPRFAIDGWEDLASLLDLAISLHIHAHSTGWAYKEGEPVFQGFIASPSRLAFAAQLRNFPRPPRQTALLFEAVGRDEVIEKVLGWLEDDAQYPPTPWFDGGEALGLQMFHVPWQPRNGPCGYVVVEPKWFEVHK